MATTSMPRPTLWDIITRSNDLLGGLIFSVIQVLSVVEKHFSDPIVKEHLQLAISTMSATPPPTSPSLSETSLNGRGKSRHKRKYVGGMPSSKGKKSAVSKGEGLTPRDVRANFYSKVC